MKTLSKNINIKNICADCSKYLIFCRVSDPGFVVEFQQEINKVIKNPNNSSDDSLAECVPDAYQITDLLEGSACFWSSELGCHKVLGRRDQERGFNDLSCVECLSRCPCSKSSSVMGQITLISIVDRQLQLKDNETDDDNICIGSWPGSQLPSSPVECPAVSPSNKCHCKFFFMPCPLLP
ncbi:hypothetical protein ACLKA7_001086 [Drosophila subpalustris]